ncbi:hypothetical protein GCK72_018852 [Caenorhabditis remanei]|uniref:Large ribosomal subunit protein uL4m n=1 Tax=Caenorhabditis remanei TaxID=31234 RepID=A0A6A5GAZ2_CAERE|nr:hypothetical protein GCK72_018852 [Caenorhabditis remanei]KAF1752298.1 hypothetical protein GCK72_018852 [Caenorhabditis remanei]
MLSRQIRSLISSRALSVAVQDATSSSSSAVSDTRRELWRKPDSPFVKTPQAWVSSLETIEDEKLGLVDLHPDIFRATPRIDILHRNLTWQSVYRNVQMTKMLTKAEMPGGGRKPWPQKKTGRAHVGSIRAPQFIRGGFANGVRGPRTWFYMLPDAVRIQGLCVALTLKHAQDDLHIVDNIQNLQNEDPKYWIDLCEARNYGYSVLFVDDNDELTGGLAEAQQALPWLNVMPVYGLNCFSLIKYDTVVLTRSALDKIEERLLTHIHRAGPLNKKYKYMDMKEKILQEAEAEEDPLMPPVV